MKEARIYHTDEAASKLLYYILDNVDTSNDTKIGKEWRKVATPEDGWFFAGDLYSIVNIVKTDRVIKDLDRYDFIEVKVFEARFKGRTQRKKAIRISPYIDKNTVKKLFNELKSTIQLINKELECDI